MELKTKTICSVIICVARISSQNMLVPILFVTARVPPTHLVVREETVTRDTVWAGATGRTTQYYIRSDTGETYPQLVHVQP